MRILVAVLAVAALVLLGWLGSFDMYLSLALGDVALAQLGWVDLLPAAVAVFTLLGAVVVFFSPLLAMVCFLLAGGAGGYRAYGIDLVEAAIWAGTGLVFAVLCLAAKFASGGSRRRLAKGEVMFKGTKTSVALVLAYLETGCTVNEVLADFPQLEREAVEQVAQLLDLKTKPEEVLAATEVDQAETQF